MSRSQQQTVKAQPDVGRLAATRSATALVALFAVACLSSSAVGQATGRNAVVAGIKSFEEGRADKAVTTLSAVIGKGGLSPQDLAKAFYFRGLAYRKQKQPALAIADLTSAIWLKDGLGEAERTAALEARSAAYRDAGLPDPGPPPGLPAPASAAAQPPAGASAPTASPATQGSGNWLASSSADEQPAASNGPLSGVGTFFSGLFNGGSAPATAASPSGSPPSAPLETASTGASSTTAVSAWTSATDVVVAKPTEPRAGRQAAATRAPAPTPTAVKGKYQVQVAAVRSRAEAETLAGELAARHAGEIGSRSPTIDETVFGSMGTFYRVSVGPFASTGETEKACRAFKASGYDCLVVTN
ncbi:MAG: SPOR domain-containing protein [Hyphomicrobiaceae bacterium]|nr:SPOR domain-containing protein [Hyphomicrobiaceae bacterium]